METEIRSSSPISCEEATMGFSGVTFGAHVDFPSQERNLSSPFPQVSQQYESCTSSTSMGVPATHWRFNEPFQLSQSSQAVPASMTELLQAPLSEPLDEDFWNSFQCESQPKK